MHLFLTSSPCNDDVPFGVDLPCIFFEKNRFVENLQKRVRPEARLLVIPADPESYELNNEMANTFANCFEYHDMMIASVEILDARHADYAPQMVAQSDIILLGGGHVPTANAFYHAIGLPALLQGYSGVIMGVSAGSMNCASTVYAQPELDGESVDPDYQRYLPGLNLTDIMILPHYQKVKDYMLDGRRLYEDITYGDSYGKRFIAMPDASYILCENGRATLYGEGYLISEGRKHKICRDGHYARIYT